MPDAPFLFDELSEPLPETSLPVYTSPIEQATFDIMELVDTFFRSSVSVEEYDTVQKKVKSILTEKFDAKKDPSNHGNRPLLIVHNEQD